MAQYMTTHIEDHTGATLEKKLPHWGPMGWIWTTLQLEKLSFSYGDADLYSSVVFSYVLYVYAYCICPLLN